MTFVEKTAGKNGWAGSETQITVWNLRLNAGKIRNCVMRLRAVHQTSAFISNFLNTLRRYFYTEKQHSYLSEEAGLYSIAL